MLSGVPSPLLSLSAPLSVISAPALSLTLLVKVATTLLASLVCQTNGTLTMAPESSVILKPSGLLSASVPSATSSPLCVTLNVATQVSGPGVAAAVSLKVMTPISVRTTLPVLSSTLRLMP